MPIKLGLVHCDTHGFYYGALMTKCDPIALEKHNKIVHYYATDWYDPAHVTVPKTWDFDIVKCYDDDRAAAEGFAESFPGAKVCDTMEQVGEGVDAVFLAECDGDGSTHLEWARPFLERGIPTFVDKPMALTLADAKEIVRLARKHNAPMYNSSILTEVIAADNFKRRFAEIGPEGADWRSLSQAAAMMGCEPEEVPGVRFGLVKGLGGAMSQENVGSRTEGAGLCGRLAYLIHGVALALNVFGSDVEWVECMGRVALEYLHLHLKSGIDVMIANTGPDSFPERCNFYVSAYSKMGEIHSGPIGDPEFLRGADRIVKKFRDMVLTGQPPKDYDELLIPIAVVEAGITAQNSGERVALAELL